MFAKNTKTTIFPFTGHLKSVLFLTIIFLASCTTGRNLVYFSDLKSEASNQTPVANNIEPKIQTDDLLGIVVSSQNAESNLLFNSGMLLPAGPIAGANAAASRPSEGYLVDSNGEINFPIVGKIKLAGLTKEEATDKITGIIGKSVKMPIITVRYLNFRVTVIGEVSKPASFIVPTEKINLLEALGLAGDMTAYGRRDNVLIIREKNNIRSTTRVNLNNKALLNSPYFYLQQNDIVYVEPDKVKALQVSARNTNLPIYLSFISLAAILLANFRYLRN